MFKLLNFFRKKYVALNKIEVSRNNLLLNYRYLSSLNRKVKIAPVVKSNGYGHGIINVAKIFDHLNAPFFCVDSLYEAYELLKAKIKTPILITGYTNPENLKVKRLPFSYAVFTLDLAKAINDYQPEAGVHIFVDTGMHREGVSIDELPEFLNKIKQLPNLKIEGLMSHLASSEGNKDLSFIAQIKQFKKAKEIFKKHKINPRWFHIAATGSIINPETRPIIASISNLARAGLALYGFSSTTFDKNLKPALTLKTKIIQIKKVLKGEKLGYDGTYTAKTNLTIGVLPIGYYDGVDRRLSNKGIFLINNIPCPILGRVSMNVNIIDLKLVPNPKVEQEVVVYSSNPKDKNSIANSAKICKTIPYDLLVNLAESTKRIIV
ncbi:MAG: alanine racemase [bacterium]|nr:alanine racemase [bacterium]